MIARYAVFGRPIAHSLSPWIHAQFAEQAHIDLDYSAILVGEDFSSTLNQFRADGGKGGNVTVPFKEEAYRLASIIHPRAQRAQAVNTLWWDDEGILHGDNTDGYGFINDLTDHAHYSLAKRSLLIIGAGGAVMGTLGAIIDAHPQRIVIANRTLNRAERLIAQFSSPPPTTKLSAIALSLLSHWQDEAFDLIINASSIGISSDSDLVLSKNLTHRQTLLYDMVYGKSTPTSILAQTQGLNYRQGLGMLVEQAAESFRLWHGIRPETTTVLQALMQRPRINY